MEDNEKQVLNIPVFAARDVADESWLQEASYEWFRAGYAYARTQTGAIPALAKVTPEELYHAVSSVIRGVGFYGKTLPPANEI